MRDIVDIFIDFLNEYNPYLLWTNKEIVYTDNNEVHYEILHLSSQESVDIFENDFKKEINELFGNKMKFEMCFYSYPIKKGMIIKIKFEKL